ncbi:class V aminotransferase [Bordetella pertussis]|nr:class V aminotransferase [Bordetella pertussis]
MPATLTDELVAALRARTPGAQGAFIHFNSQPRLR